MPVVTSENLCQELIQIKLAGREGCREEISMPSASMEFAGFFKHYNLNHVKPFLKGETLLILQSSSKEFSGNSHRARKAIVFPRVVYFSFLTKEKQWNLSPHPSCCSPDQAGNAALGCCRKGASPAAMLGWARTVEPILWPQRIKDELPFFCR